MVVVVVVAERGRRRAGTGSDAKYEQRAAGTWPAHGSLLPAAAGRDAALTVTVNAGDMLYLPAGWFHEVTSYSRPGEWVHEGSSEAGEWVRKGTSDGGGAGA
jgi:hypothetical protein